jgi:hypothetical protein
VQGRLRVEVERRYRVVPPGHAGSVRHLGERSIERVGEFGILQKRLACCLRVFIKGRDVFWCR